MISHYLLDGLGLVVALANALQGNTRDLGYPPPRSRTRLRAVAQDARSTTRDVPEVGRALVMAAKLARRRRHDTAPPPASRAVAVRGSESSDAIVMPSVTISVDLEDWDARAKALGGTSNTQVAALAAKLGERMGRRRASDGAVTLQLPMSERTEDAHVRSQYRSHASASIRRG